MVDFLWQYLDRVADYAGSLDRNQWIVLAVAVVLVGFICMRGFGSRNNY
jgi:hypothetical protein